MAWELGPDGDWERVVPVLGISAQRRLQELALNVHAGAARPNR